MKKLFLFVAFVAMSMLSMAQKNQLVWANGRLLYGTPIVSIDSLTFDEMQGVDTLQLLLPSALVKHDTVLKYVYIHDTIVEVKTQIVHDTVYVEVDCDDANTDATSTQTFTVNGVSFTMVGVEGGTFTMGATSEQGTSDPWDDEYPTHSVTLSTFSIGETEVTQELWKAVMGSNPSYFSGTNLPVEYVSWNDCQTFITKLNQLTGKNFRLPTEAEWEYAARGGNKSKGYKYAGSNNLSDVAWYSDNSSSKTHPVKQKQANELGLYDMSGNVWEWCQDWFGNYSSGSQTNPSGPSTGSYRVYRGGSWSINARYCRVSYRNHSAPTLCSHNLGLRLAL